MEKTTRKHTPTHLDTDTDTNTDTHTRIHTPQGMAGTARPELRSSESQGDKWAENTWNGNCIGYTRQLKAQIWGTRKLGLSDSGLCRPTRKGQIASETPDIKLSSNYGTYSPNSHHRWMHCGRWTKSWINEPPRILGQSTLQWCLCVHPQ